MKFQKSIYLLLLLILCLVIAGCEGPITEQLNGTISGYLYGDTINLQITNSPTAPPTMSAVNYGKITIHGKITILGKSFTFTTDSIGYFYIPNVSPGSYTVNATFNEVTESFPVTVIAGQTAIPVSNDIYRTIKNNITVDTSCFNDKFIYTMISAQPTSKPESNSAASVTYPYQFSTTSGSLSKISALYYNEKDSGWYNDSFPNSIMTNHDLLFRDQENKALFTRSKQITAKSPPSTPVVGTTWNGVHILNSSSTWVTIDTTCRYVSTYTCVFVDNRNTASMSPYLSEYGNAFDTIYQTDINKFGTPNNTDGNSKIIVVFSQELVGGQVGYFTSIDKYPNTANPNSNEGDIIYATTETTYQGDSVKATFAHELQHMIYFDQHYNYGVTNTFIWLNEALSQAAEYYTGYTTNHETYMRTYLNGGWPGISLTHWASGNYGCSALFIRYLIDQYGDKAIKNMCSTSNVGIAAVEAATSEDFNYIYNNFTRALVMSGTGDSINPLYTFTSLDLQTLQPDGRGGLNTSSAYSAGNQVGGGLYPYRIFFAQWSGSFGTMNLSGSDIGGTGFGLSR